MSTVLRMFKPSGRDGGHRFLILDCGHWYHWTGKQPPKQDAEFPCPACKPPIVVIGDDNGKTSTQDDKGDDQTPHARPDRT